MVKFLDELVYLFFVNFVFYLWYLLYYVCFQCLEAAALDLIELSVTVPFLFPIVLLHPLFWVGLSCVFDACHVCDHIWRVIYKLLHTLYPFY